MKNIPSTSLIRGIYLALLNFRRTYAAFTPDHLRYAEVLKDRGPILDPMSGYGGLMSYCTSSEYSITSYGIEINFPSYLWQVLVHPKNVIYFEELADCLLSCEKKWPKEKNKLTISDDWFHEESFSLLEELWQLVFDLAEDRPVFSKEELVLALISPFVGRLSNTIQGNVVTHVKKGGICVYKDWQKDFRTYLEKVKANCKDTRSISHNINQGITFGDSRYIELGENKFSAMLTSPPYPNGRDYSKMFKPENVFIEWLVEHNYITNHISQDRIIGSSDVSKSGINTKKTPEEVKSKVAGEFIQFIKDFKGSKRAICDNKTYYLPYYCNYFYGLEQAYCNISKYIADDFLGYIVVVNNTARKRVIPVSEFVIETWNELGFDAHKCESRELSHMGGINPRVKGLSARHEECIIEVRR